MKLHSIGNIENNEKCQILRNFKIWEREVEQLSINQILASFQLVKMKHSDRVAFEAFEELSNEALNDYVLGKIDHCEIVGFRPPKPKLTSEQVLEIINQFEPLQQRAIMFALYTDLSIRTVSKLTYNTISKSRDRLNEPYTEGADYILQTQPRHLHTNFVFWEFNRAKIPTPFLNMEGEFIARTKFSWGEFVNHVNLIFKYDYQNFENC